jgi:hypothetical protein
MGIHREMDLFDGPGYTQEQTRRLLLWLRKHNTQPRHTRRSICNQPVLPVSRSVACVLLSGSAPSSSACLYLSAAALSRATCSARSLQFTVSNCQGPALLGGIGSGGWAMWSRDRENDTEARKGRFENVEVEVALYDPYGFRKGGNAVQWTLFGTFDRLDQ